MKTVVCPRRYLDQAKEATIGWYVHPRKITREEYERLNADLEQFMANLTEPCWIVVEDE